MLVYFDGDVTLSREVDSFGCIQGTNEPQLVLQSICAQS